MDDELTVRRANTVLYCRHWAATVAFYRDRIGFEPTFENEWLVEFRVTEDSCISVADSSRTTIDDVGGQGITLTFQVDDVAVTRAALVARGVSVSDLRRRWGSDVCYSLDPEGHRLEWWSTPRRGNDQMVSG